MDCFRLRSLSYGGQVVATLLAMTVSNSKHAFSSRGVKRPSRSRNIRPGKSEGEGKAGCPLHPQTVCIGSKHTVVTTGTPEQPAFPAQWFYGLLRALPGDEFVLSPSSAD